MRRQLCAGSMLLKDGTQLPEFLEVGTEEYSPGWSFISEFTSADLGKAIEAEEWTFFFMAGEIQARGIGFSIRSGLARAVSNMTDAVTRENCNCLEITESRQRTFFGLHWTTLAAHARHIQKSRTFHDRPPLPLRALQKPVEWLYSQKASSPNKPASPGEAINTWENEGGSQLSRGVPTKDSNEEVLHV